MSLVYISGITEDAYAPDFERAQKLLEQNGHQVANPINYKKSLQTKLGHVPTSAQLFKRKLERLMECDAIYKLGEKVTNDVILERNVAEELGILELDILRAGR